MQYNRDQLYISGNTRDSLQSDIALPEQRQTKGENQTENINIVLPQQTRGNQSEKIALPTNVTSNNGEIEQQGTKNDNLYITELTPKKWIQNYKLYVQI